MTLSPSQSRLVGISRRPSPTTTQFSIQLPVVFLLPVTESRHRAATLPVRVMAECALRASTRRCLQSPKERRQKTKRTVGASERASADDWSARLGVDLHYDLLQSLPPTRWLPPTLLLPLTMLRLADCFAKINGLAPRCLAGSAGPRPLRCIVAPR